MYLKKYLTIFKELRYYKPCRYGVVWYMPYRKKNRISVILETIHSSGMMNEQHIFCYAYYEGGYFYAKKQISRRYFHNYHGVRDGLYHDLLQHCSQRRRNE